jgi:hypothetical protein
MIRFWLCSAGQARRTDEAYSDQPMLLAAEGGRVKVPVPITDKDLVVEKQRRRLTKRARVREGVSA